ncbi:MAG: 4-(cytidine 5'-diphospho)-2-C-methyl-D-erythritol kinase [Gammaproteobacteria bacterium]|nr:4-(cytidine 5'-diphospho)-2-C-methyl-D-erythritol kinase [Gammaproteobacteria bacterium]
MALSASTPWPAPAKLNLFLHITGRRPDGYHLLQTVFQFLSVGDELRFEPRADGRIMRVNAIAAIPAEQDLAVRAALALQAATGSAQGADIEITKNLPVGGGLGGGSSDAATTLVALNHLWRCGLSRDELMSLGLALGADVPVFVYGRAAWAEGVGERLQTIDLPEQWFVVLKPDVAIATTNVFGAPELTRNCPPITMLDFLSNGGANVCEPVVRRRYPEVAEVLGWLNDFSPARLTGTGSCVFAAFDTRASAAQVLVQAPSTWRGFVARGCNRSPLQATLAYDPG